MMEGVKSWKKIAKCTERGQQSTGYFTQAAPNSRFMPRCYGALMRCEGQSSPQPAEDRSFCLSYQSRLASIHLQYWPLWFMTMFCVNKQQMHKLAVIIYSLTHGASLVPDSHQCRSNMTGCVPLQQICLVRRGVWPWPVSLPKATFSFIKWQD